MVETGVITDIKPIVDLDDNQLNAFLQERQAEIVPLEKRYEQEKLPQVIKFKLHQPAQLDKLPPGYLYMGGCARNVVLEEYGERVEPARDVDLVGILEFNPDFSKREELSRQYMTEDDKQGYSLRIDCLTDYFVERDFSINELLTDGVYVYATPQALKDLRDKVIRPTAYENQGGKQSHKRDSLSSKLLVKALRLFLEFKQTYGQATMTEIKEWEFDMHNIRIFDIALQLDKAVQNGDSIAEEFASVLLQTGVVGAYKGEQLFKANNASELVMSIRGKLYNYIFKSPKLISLMQNATMSQRTTSLAELYLHRIRHLPEWRNEVV